MSRRPKFVVHQGKDGQWYVRLVAGNGQILMASEGYTRQGNAYRSARAARRAMETISSWKIAKAIDNDGHDDEWVTYA